MIGRIKEWWKQRKARKQLEEENRVLGDRIFRLINRVHDDEYMAALKRVIPESEFDVFGIKNSLLQAMYVHPFVFVKSVSYPFGDLDSCVGGGFVLDNGSYERQVIEDIFSGDKMPLSERWFTRIKIFSDPQKTAVQTFLDQTESKINEEIRLIREKRKNVEHEKAVKVHEKITEIIQNAG